MPNANSLQIMVVDDQRAMRALVTSSLREIGCTDIMECCDGQDALETLALHPRNLIISDLNMPRLDGLGLLAAIRADPVLKATAVIMLTSRGEINLVQKAVQLGVNNYLMKPFSMAGLKKKIEAVVGPLT